MSEKLDELSTEELMKKHREAVVYTALSNNGADKVCRAAEAEYEGEVRRRLENWHVAELLRKVRAYYPVHRTTLDG